MSEAIITITAAHVSKRESELKAQRLLQEHKVSVALEDNRSYEQIAHALGLLELQTTVDIVAE